MARIGQKIGIGLALLVVGLVFSEPTQYVQAESVVDSNGHYRETIDLSDYDDRVMIHVEGGSLVEVNNWYDNPYDDTDVGEYKESFGSYITPNHYRPALDLNASKDYELVVDAPDGKYTVSIEDANTKASAFDFSNMPIKHGNALTFQQSTEKGNETYVDVSLEKGREYVFVVRNHEAFKLLAPDGSAVKEYTAQNSSGTTVRRNADMLFTIQPSVTGTYTVWGGAEEGYTPFELSLYEMIDLDGLADMKEMSLDIGTPNQMIGGRFYAVKADKQKPYVMTPKWSIEDGYVLDFKVERLTSRGSTNDGYRDAYAQDIEFWQQVRNGNTLKSQVFYTEDDEEQVHIHEWSWLKGNVSIDLNGFSFAAKSGDAAKKYVEVLNAEDRQSSLVADPVDAFAGNFVDSRELMSYSGNNPLSFTMNYDSIANDSAALRGGFVHNFETFIKESDDRLSVYWTPNSVVHFDLVDGAYKPVHTKQSDVTVTKSDSGFVVTDKQLQEYVFDLDGKLLLFTDKVGHETQYSYTDGQLTTVENSRGQSFVFNYDGDGRLVSVTDLMERQLQFRYADNLLVGVITPNGTELKITYANVPSSELPHKVSKFTYDGVTLVQNTYDNRGRINKQWDGNGTPTEFIYDEYTNDEHVTTTITTGSRKEVLVHDRFGNLLKKTDGEGFSQTHDYDENRNVISTIDKNGHRYEHQYDTKNRLVSTLNPDGHTQTYEYDTRNQLTKITMPDGKSVVNTYDANGRLASTTDRAGNKTTYAYDAFGNPTSIQREGYHISYGYDNDTGYLTETSTNDGPITRFENDVLGRVVKTVLPDESFIETTYDVDNNVVSTTDQDGKTSTFTYNAFGNTVTETNAKGIVTTHQYDANGNRIRSKTGNREVELKYNAFNQVISTAQLENGRSRNVQTFTYTNRGELLKTEDADRVGSSMTYDGNGNVLTRTSNNSVVTYTYDEMGNNTAITDSYGNKTMFTYDAVGNVLSEKTPGEAESIYSYDAMGRLSSIVDPLGHETTYTYDVRGNLLRVKDANGAETQYEYNDANQKIAEINALGERQTFKYNALGQLVRVTNHRDETVLSYTYDGVGNIAMITDGNGHTNAFTYDANGNQLTFTDAMGHVSETLTYNTYDELSKTTDALGNETVFAYDGLGNLSTITDPKGQVSTHRYTASNRLANVVDPLNTQVDYTYDRYGQIAKIGQGWDPNQAFTRDLNQNLIEERFYRSSIKYEYTTENELSKKTTARKQILSYEYDANGRLIKEVAPEGTTTYEYDAVGNLLVVDSGTSRIERTYDALGRVLTKTQDGQTIQYEYDDRGHLVRMVYPTGDAVDYAYDVMGNLLTVTDWNGRKTQYEYNANNQLTKTLHANGTAEIRTYDAKGQVLTLVNQKDDEVLSAYAYEYDANGNIAKENDVVLKYDALNRLTQAGSNTYAYSPLGNITSFKTALSDGSAYTQTMTYGENDELERINDVRTTVDADGNLTNYTLDGVQHDAVYNSQNQLVSFDGVTYKYDGENNRIGLVDSDSETSFIVDNDSHAHSRVLVETTGNESIYHVYGHGLIGSYTADEEFETHHYDYRGSTTGVSDESGKLIGSVSYDEYGLISHQDETIKTRFLYNGQYGVQTDANGLYYMRARFYNPALKRFMNRDVVVGSIEQSQTLNRYAFVNGNPISYHDPFGLARETLSNTISSVTSMLHTGLDLAGMIPGFGMVPDAINAGLYLAKGDYTNMALSSMAILPFVGDAATGAKYVGKYADDVAEFGIKGYNKVKHSDDLLKMDLQTFAKKQYRDTFFKEYPDLKGKVVVHHAVEQQVMRRYPDLFSLDEIHDISNLRGIPKELNSDLHLSKIRKDWNKFYKHNTNPTKDDVLNYMTELDSKYGAFFKPPLK